MNSPELLILIIRKTVIQARPVILDIKSLSSTESELFKTSFQTVANLSFRAALKTHPDRVSSDSPERSARTQKFQIINDAYYTLSEPSRRRDYDAARVYHGFGSGASTASTAWDSDEEIPDPNAQASGSAPGGFPWSSFGFSSKAKNQEEEQRFENEQFGDVFEEMLREEGMAENGGTPTGKFWSVVGGLSGGAMGFIVANFPGSKFFLSSTACNATQSFALFGRLKGMLFFGFSWSGYPRLQLLEMYEGLLVAAQSIASISLKTIELLADS
jgi:diphthamide biosynthesis protein 4